MRTLHKSDMAQLIAARGVLEAINGAPLGDVDALVADCKPGKAVPVVGLLLVLVTVEGGIADVAETPPGVEVTILDWDNARDGQAAEILADLPPGLGNREVRRTLQRMAREQARES